MDKAKQIELTEDIIEIGYNLLINKLAFGGLKAQNEAAFQLEFGHILKTLGQLYEFRVEDKFHLEFESYLGLNGRSIKSKSERARVDIITYYQDDENSTRAAIELKFFKKENHREPNNRYDVFKDLSNLELYKKEGIDLCYFILATDHSHYVNQKDYSINTKDFDFRDGVEYRAGEQLVYNTEKPYDDPLTLTQNYKFKWHNVNELYFLKIKV